jgi:hypothetical protein
VNDIGYACRGQANESSRVYLGLHWKFDAEGGDVSGRKIESYWINQEALRNEG